MTTSWGIIGMCAVALLGCGGSDRATPSGATEVQPTAQDRSERSEDVTITKRIRDSLTADERLSHAAVTITIITAGGRVLLRGTVRNQREKAEVGIKAREIAGVDAVDNDLDVER
ncbi:MAG: BON domain-containing protein [Planctomycetes bacterium]|nr:BON domain-containing protein [Planctomycetota bacterium]